VILVSIVLVVAKAKNVLVAEVVIMNTMTDKELISKWLDDFLSDHHRLMTKDEFIKEFNGHEALYDSIGHDLEKEGKLAPSQPKEIQEELFGKQPLDYITVTVRPYQRTVKTYMKEGGISYKIVQVKGYTRKVQVNKK
jgi:hypothetical protein